MKIIGAGFGRTGTLSLKLALEQLGFDKCYHMMEVREHPEHTDVWRRAHRGEAVDWEALYTGYQATVDWPSCNLWQELAEHYPDAKVLLTQRDSAKWYASVMNTIYKFSTAGLDSDDPAARAGSEWAKEIIWDRVFDGRMDDEAYVRGVFERHNKAVQEAVPAERLLVYQPGDGWEPLCRFLDVPVPARDYPHVNSTQEFVERVGSSGT